jgi:Na+/proline symporter
MHDDLALAGILLYVLAQLAIGVWVSRRLRTEDDYLLGGRRLGYGLATFSIFATWFGAETCIGAAGRVFAGGLSAAAVEPLGYALCILLMAALFAGPLHRRRLTTLADLFRERFGRRVERLAVLLMVPTSLLWAAAQVRAFGQILAASSSLETTVAIGLAALVVIAYTALGGLLADAWSDLVQGVVLVLGLGGLAVLALAELGGPAAALARVEPARLSPFAADVSWLAAADHLATPVIGSVLAQELISRVLASRSAPVARRSAVLAALLYFAVGLVPVGLGLAAGPLVAEVEHPDRFLGQVAQRLLPGGLYVIFAGAVLSAVLSTVDTTLLVSGSLLSHNLVVPLLRRADEARKVALARGFVVLSGLAAWALAYSADSVYELVYDASAFGSAGIFVAVAFGLFTGFGGAGAASAALLAGVLAFVAGSAAGVEAPFLLSLAAAALAYLAVGFATLPGGRRAPRG